jgi:glycosyltransferase involved in cell wall biosynthesis
MTRFSLIIATLGRDRDLAVLFDSLLAQQRDDFEVIVVDQNRDERLAPILAAYAPRLALAHLRTERAHANAARNLGLRAARGEIVAFPDDDCWLPDGVLARVDAAFADVTLAVLTGPAAAPKGGLGSGRWRADAGAITPKNVWTSVIEFNLWLRRDVALALGGLDERLGPGTPWGSAEGNDLVARALRAGHRALYDPELRIVHPDKRLSDIALARARVYGAGLGVALRRHAPLGVAVRFAIRPLGGALLALTRGDVAAARYYAATLAGRLSGYFARDAAR